MIGSSPSAPSRLPSAGRIALVSGILLLVAVPAAIAYSTFARQALIRQLAEDGVSIHRDRASPEWIRSRLPEKWSETFDPVTQLHVHFKNNFDDARMRQIQSFSRLRSLAIYDSKVTDGGLEYLAAFPALRELKLVRVRMTDAGLKTIGRSTRLVQLSLQDTAVTDEGMHDVARLTELTWLSLGGTRITGDGLRRLLPLSRLENLDLHGTRIADEDLALLTKFPRLRSLNVSDTPITIAGIRLLTTMTDLKVLTLPSALIDEDRLTQIREILHECHVGVAPGQPMPGWNY